MTNGRTQLEDVRLGVIHTGERYAYGFGSNFYGIWDERSGGPPAERFPATPEGRKAGWTRYLEFEPSGRTSPAAASFEEVAEAEAPRSRRALIAAIVAGVVVIAIIVALVVTKSGTKTSGAQGLGGAGGKTAKVDVSGAAVLSETLPQTVFSAAGANSLFPRIEATWKSQDLQVHILVSTPQLGENVTSQTDNTSMDITILTAGTTGASPGATVSASPTAAPSASPGATTGPLVFTSTLGECTITVTQFSEDGVKGSFTCTGVAAPGTTQTLSASGQFSASK